MTTPNPSLVVCGPQGCGKTTNADLIKTAFGLAEVVEADDPPGRTVPDYGALILTSADVDNVRIPAGSPIRLMSFADAMAQVRALPTASEILRSAAGAIEDRAKLRDCPDGERSMQRAVAAFNALHADGIRENHGHLTEVQGWQFMEILKHARSVAGGHHADDHVDRAAYAALAGEAAAAVDREEKEPF